MMKSKGIIFTSAIILTISALGIYTLFSKAKNENTLDEKTFSITGLSVNEAEQALEQKNLTFIVEDSKDSKEIDGNALTRKNVSVPQLVGMNIDDVGSIAEQHGFTFAIDE